MRLRLTLFLAMLAANLCARVGVDTTGKTNVVSGPTDFGTNAIVFGGTSRTNWPTEFDEVDPKFVEWTNDSTIVAGASAAGTTMGVSIGNNAGSSAAGVGIGSYAHGEQIGVGC